MEEATSIQDFEDINDIDFRKQIMIGIGVLIGYFLLFGYQTLPVCIQSQIHSVIIGTTNRDYLYILKYVLSIISLILFNLGYGYFFIGIRKLNKTKKKAEKQRPSLFFIIYSFALIATNLMLVLELSAYAVDAAIGGIPLGPGITILGTIMFSSWVEFGIVVFMTIFLGCYLRKNKLIDLELVRRPITHFFLPVILLVWLGFILSMQNRIIPYFDGTYPGFFAIQLASSIILAGVYLELFFKIKKSERIMKEKIMGEKNGKE